MAHKEWNDLEHRAKCIVQTLERINVWLPFNFMGAMIRNARATQDLEYNITNSSFTAEGSIERLKKARRRLHLLRKCKINARTVKSLTLLNICDFFELFTATYGIHMTPMHPNLSQLWADLEKDILIHAVRTYHGAAKDRLRDIAWMHTLQ